MKYRDYFQHISFRWYQPMMYPKGFTKLNRILQRVHLSLEVLNTRLPADAKITQQRLRELLKIPRLSTYAIAALINRGVSQLAEGMCFVNIGVWHGFTFLAGMQGNADKCCIGVDNFSTLGNPKDAFLERFNCVQSQNHTFYDLDYQDYFATVHKAPIGLYLYDGDHSYLHQLRGLEIAAPFFADSCFILVDDTNRSAPRQATLDFVAKYPGRYHIVLDQNTCVADHPTFWDGLMIVQKLPTL